MRRLLLLGVLLSCSPQPDPLFNREAFENKWWEIDSWGYNICFMAHEEEELFIYEEINDEWGIYWGGPFVYEEPGIYHIQDETLIVTQKDECWKIAGYGLLSYEVCDCTLMDWPKP